jgi:hypothetical protein
LGEEELLLLEEQRIREFSQRERERERERERVGDGSSFTSG